MITKRVLWLLAVLNLSLFVAFSQLNLSEPASKLFLRSEADGLIVFGKNSLGIYRFRTFANWQQLEAYLSSRGLEIQPINDVPTEMNWGAERVSHKILWKNQGERAVLATPDKRSAKELLPHVRFKNIESSILGFAIPLRVQQLAR